MLRVNLIAISSSYRRVLRVGDAAVVTALA
jgi:hypothetical protein